MTLEQEKIKNIIRQVRDIVLPHYGNVHFEEKTQSASNVVTELDHRVEGFLRDELAKIHPEITFVGEETGGDRSAEVKWLCDPIDGTGHFVRGIPFCTTISHLLRMIRLFLVRFIIS